MTNDAPRCLTCGAPASADIGAYCSIHCEHYAGLARARSRAESEV